ncbi:MAG: threonylcarbamoyl-AMP synthase [Methanobrevibacter sp.]|jgi:L-threonylcarbamoyladenylate synthase|nr:threonylcarbamoyl-AMP synthase [Methanobrevibacter sp.]
MEILKTNGSVVDFDIIDQALEVLCNDGVIIYPTDTAYGLGANIFSINALNKVFQLKNRERSKPISACFSSLSSLFYLVEIGNKSQRIVEKNLPGPFTFIMYKKRNLGFKFFDITSHKIGVRIPNNRISMELSKIFPITATSANISGEKTLSNVKEIAKQLNGDVDLAIDVGPIIADKFSTVIDLTRPNPKVLREGLGSLRF